MLKEGGIKAGERKKNQEEGRGSCSLSMQEEKAVLPSQFPKVSLLKHSLPQGEERKGERKKNRGEEREMDGGEG